MTFTRTRVGLSNQHLFHGVDVVVFVEGGTKTFSYANVCNGYAGTSSLDILYWQAVFHVMVPETKTRFKPVGSKSTLRQLAEDVRQGNITQVYVAMDQDLDRFHGTRIEADGVFYTWGYSWENDLLHDIALKEAVFAVCPIDRTTNEGAVDADISATIDKFIKQARWFICADIILSKCGPGLFDRKNWKKYVKSASGQYGEPHFEIDDLRQKIRNINSAKGHRQYAGVETPIETKRDCFGHIIGTFLCRLFSYLVAKYSGSPGFSVVNACGLVIQSFRDNLAHPCLANVQRHHEAQFAFLAN